MTAEKFADVMVIEWSQYKTLRIVYGEGNINNKLYHIRGQVDDNLIVRRWLKHKQRWQYECLSGVFLGVNNDYLELGK